MLIRTLYIKLQSFFSKKNKTIKFCSFINLEEHQDFSNTKTTNELSYWINEMYKEQPEDLTLGYDFIKISKNDNK